MISDISPPQYLSPSSLSTFNQCPQKFKFNKIDLIPDPSNHWAVLGNFVHDILEEMYKLPPEMRVIESARLIAKDMWDSKWADEAYRVLRTDKEIKDFRWTAWFCVENLWLIEDPKLVAPTGLEFELNGQIGGVQIRGFIDRYGPSKDSLMLTVSDYKTGKTPKGSYVDEKFTQLLLYAILLSNLGVGDVDKVELLYLKDGVRLEKTITTADIEKTTEYVLETKQEVDNSCKTGVFEARTSYLCNFCSLLRG
jgi:putative RecB family exonuclease